jgi:hypothetical protein
VRAPKEGGGEAFARGSRVALAGRSPTAMARCHSEVGHDGVVIEVPESGRRLVWGGGLPQLRQRRGSGSGGRPASPAGARATRSAAPWG